MHEQKDKMIRKEIHNGRTARLYKALTAALGKRELY